MEVKSFDVPTQVAFWESEGGHYVGGIAYGEEIICLCCGGTVEIAEVIEFAPEGITPIVVYSDWEDLSDQALVDDERFFEWEEEREEEECVD